MQQSVENEFAILVADDEEAMRAVVGDALNRRVACRIDKAADGAAVLDALAGFGYELLILDMIMPGLHGLELVRRVAGEYPDVDIMVMTGYIEDFPFVEVVKAGATDFIVKPFGMEELVAKVTRIQNERATRRAHELAERKFESIFQLSIDSMVLLDRESCTVLDANRAFVTLSGQPLEAVRGRPFIEFLGPSDRDRFKLALGICGAGGTLGDVTIEREDGPSVCVDVSVTFLDLYAEHHIFLALKDVTEKREVERQLAEAAVTDGLTGLMNKSSFDRQVAGAVRRAAQKGDSLTLVMFDLDNFKACNDTHGHQTGDGLLTSLGGLVTQCIRDDTDEGFRIGGDEFAIMLPSADVEVGARIAERLRSLFTRNQVFGTTLSIGVAQWKPGLTAKQFIEMADRALYQAKARGKNTVATA